MNVNPELGKPEGSYFGIVVTDGYDWHQCYSWAWECAKYWDTDSKTGESRSVHDAFPDVKWDRWDEKKKCVIRGEERGLMEQVMAINKKLTDRPKKVFFEKTVIERRR